MTCGTTSVYNSDATTNTFDLFLIKFDPLGNLLWLKSAGASNTYEYSSNLTTDTDGNIILTGTVVQSGPGYLFVRKYDPNGNMLWTMNPLGIEPKTEGITTDANNNIFLTGFYAPIDTLKFGSLAMPPVGNGIGYSDMFTVKLDSNGNALWGKTAGGNLEDYGNSVSTDAAGNAIVTGYFNDTITFGSTTLIDTVPGAGSIFIVKYDPSGNIIWSKASGNLYYSGYNDMPTGSTDYDGNIIVTGTFDASDITFDNITLNNSGPGQRDMFLVKYDSAGTIQWAKSGGGSGDQYAYDVAADRQGNIFVSSNLIGQPFAFDTLNYSNNAGTDMTIIKCDAMGNPLWTKGITGGSPSQSGESIATDSSGNILFAGILELGHVTIGHDSIANSTPQGGYQDVFIAKLNAITYPPCYAYYATAYDSASNTFSLLVDSATAAVAASYKWNFGDGTSSSLMAPTHFYAVDSIYNLCMKVYNVYGDSCYYCHDVGIDDNGNIIRNGGFNLVVVPGATTGITTAPASESPNTIIYPNPNNGLFSLESSKNLLNIEVVNILGERIYSLAPTNNLKNKKINIDLTNQPSGIYFVIINAEKEIITKRVSVNR